VLSFYFFPRDLICRQDCSDPDTEASGNAMEEGGEEEVVQEESAEMSPDINGSKRRFANPFANVGDDPDSEFVAETSL